MATDRQVRANRGNAKKSTGPRTTAGKAKSSQNSVKHGLLAASPLAPGETREQWESYTSGIVGNLQPVGDVEEALARRIADLLWRLARVSRIESASLESAEKRMRIDELQIEIARLDDFAIRMAPRRKHLGPLAALDPERYRDATYRDPVVEQAERHRARLHVA